MFNILFVSTKKKTPVRDPALSVCSLYNSNIDICHIIHLLSLQWLYGRTLNVKILAFDQFIFFPSKVKCGLINPFPLMQSKKLYPPHIMFHPASPTVMASQIGLSWGGLGLLCSCCCLIWGLGVLQVLTWLDLKDLQTHINILYETTDHDANESLALQKREHYVMFM